jgi:hypothetical protein
MDTIKLLTENADLRTQLAEAQAREGALRDRAVTVLKKFTAWQDTPDWVCDEFDDFCGALEAMDNAIPETPAPVNLEAMKRVVDCAHDVVADFEESIANYPQVLDLAKALADLEGGACGAGW